MAGVACLGARGRCPGSAAGSRTSARSQLLRVGAVEVLPAWAWTFFQALWLSLAKRGGGGGELFATRVCLCVHF